VGRNGAGFLRLVILTALVGAGCTSGSSETSTARGDLPDGFHTVPRTRLLGAAFPEILFSRSGYGKPRPGERQWSAFFAVEGDGKRVYDGLAAQAVAAGLPPMESSKTACLSRGRADVPIGNDDLRCTGSSVLPDRSESFNVSVQICSRCKPKVSAAWIGYYAATSPHGGLTQWKQLDPRAVFRGNGRTFARWPILVGTKLLARPHFDQCTGGDLLLLTVTGDPDDVWSDYYAELQSEGSIKGQASAVFDGRVVKQVSIAPTDYGRTVTFIEGQDGERPLLVLESCG
jgi:hypothetical protein